MIVISTPGPLEEQFLREILSPLGRTVETYTPEKTDAALGVVWLKDKRANEAAQTVSQTAHRLILLAPAEYDRQEIGMLGPDIIIKLPLRPGVLTDKARTLLARMETDRLPARLTIGPYEFLPRENTVHDKNTKKIHKLTDKERDILLTLHAAGGQAVSRQALLDSVWAYAPGVETHTLETHIYRLRQRIEKDPAAPEIVLTDEAGYRLSRG